MLTQTVIRDARPGPKPAIIWDRHVKGLGLRVTPGGAKSFVLNYRVDGRERRMTLARAGELTLKQARARAQELLLAVRGGRADPLETRRQRREAPTVADAFERFLGSFSERRIANGRMTERTRSEYRKGAARYVIPNWGNRKLASVTRADVERLVDPMPGPTRNRVLALISRVFTVAEAWEWRPQHTNPARGVERAVEQPRDRVLTAGELAALSTALAALEADYPTPIAAIRVAAVTGLRISEVLAMQWDHIDTEAGRVRLPETKTGARTHDLPSAALAILKGLPRIVGVSHVFFGRRGPAAYKHTRAVFAKAIERAGLDDVRLHDLRRTVMTQAAAAGVGTHVLRDLLGHKSAAMADRYIRAVGNPVREAREAVGEAMADMMANGGGKVVPLRRR